MRAIFLDTETGGLDSSKHPLLEIAFIITDLNTKQILCSYNSLIKPSQAEWTFCDQQALKINGFKYLEFNDAPDISQVADEILEIFQNLNIHRKNAVFICQNPSFDRVFFTQILNVVLQEEMNIPYHWLDLASMFWGFCMERAKTSQSPFPWEIGFTKDKIATFFHLDKEAQPHRAINGVNHLIACYEALVGFPSKIKV